MSALKKLRKDIETIIESYSAVDTLMEPEIVDEIIDKVVEYAGILLLKEICENDTAN